MSVQVPAFTYLKSKVILLESIFSFFKEFLCKIFHFYQPYINFQILTNIFIFLIIDITNNSNTYRVYIY